MTILCPTGGFTGVFSPPRGSRATQKRETEKSAQNFREKVKARKQRENRLQPTDVQRSTDVQRKAGQRDEDGISRYLYNNTEYDIQSNRTQKSHTQERGCEPAGARNTEEDPERPRRKGTCDSHSERAGVLESRHEDRGEGTVVDRERRDDLIVVVSFLPSPRTPLPSIKTMLLLMVWKTVPECLNSSS